jgi:hypothetical protein
LEWLRILHFDKFADSLSFRGVRKHIL